jgi:hypothetical protein
VVFLFDRIEHKNVALVFGHRDAHAIHTLACSYFLRRVADMNFLPMRFNEAESHFVEEVANFVSGEWNPYRTRRNLIYIR